MNRNMVGKLVPGTKSLVFLEFWMEAFRGREVRWYILDNILDLDYSLAL